MNIRQYKITYQIFNFFNRNKLLHNLPLYRKYGLKKKYFSSISSEDFRGLKSDLNINDSKDSRTAMPNNLSFKSLDPHVKKPLLSWSENGYAILENFFSEKEIDSCNEEIESLLQNKKVKFRYGNKVMFAFHHSEIIKNIGTNEKLLEILNIILGKKVAFNIKKDSPIQRKDIKW